MANEGVHIEF